MHPGWSYGVVIDAFAQHRQGMVTGMFSAALLFMGAAVSSLLQHRFRFVFFQPIAAIRCLLGGVVMGYGAHQIPGGNDTLLLWAIPGLTRYGLIAYGVMAFTIAAAFAVDKQRRSRPAPTRSMPES
jgi:toxin CptA